MQFELKSTSEQKTYLLTTKLLKTYEPNEVYAIDFSQIKTLSGIMWMRVAGDEITGKIEFLELTITNLVKLYLDIWETYQVLPKLLILIMGLVIWLTMYKTF